MKIFISSLITGMETTRAAAREAVETLRHEPIMAEDFGAKPSSPQIACLQGVRQADIVALILGPNYGAVQPSGLSATHEEYREAKGKKTVLAFVQEGVSPEPSQAEFIKEVQGWEAGLFRGGFRTDRDLKIALTRAGQVPTPYRSSRVFVEFRDLEPVCGRRPASVCFAAHRIGEARPRRGDSQGSTFRSAPFV